MSDADRRRAGALTRLARIQAQEGRRDAAIASYRTLFDLDSVAVAGIPASLFGRWAICRLLAVHGMDGRREAALALRTELRRGRWQLTSEAYDANLTDLNGWLSETQSPDPTEAELLAWCRDQFAAYKYPRRIEFRDTLPIGATGKILKRELRE